MMSRIRHYAQGAFWMGTVAAITPLAMAVNALPERVAVPVCNAAEAAFNRWLIGRR